MDSFLTPRLIKKISVKSLEAELSWLQPINQGFEEDGDGCFCIGRQETTTTHTHTNYFKMPDLKRKHQSGIPLGCFLEANTYFNKTSHHVSY